MIKDVHINSCGRLSDGVKFGGDSLVDTEPIQDETSDTVKRSRSDVLQTKPCFVTPPHPAPVTIRDEQPSRLDRRNRPDTAFAQYVTPISGTQGAPGTGEGSGFPRGRESVRLIGRESYSEILLFV
jgi:hypothetical protein